MKMRIHRILFLQMLLILPVFFVYSQNKEALFPMRQNFKWGFINKKGEWVIEPKYNWVRPFSEGYAAVVPDPEENKKDQENKEKKSNHKGNIEMAREISRQKRNDRWKFINKKGG